MTPKIYNLQITVKVARLNNHNLDIALLTKILPIF